MDRILIFWATQKAFTLRWLVEISNNGSLWLQIPGSWINATVMRKKSYLWNNLPYMSRPFEHLKPFWDFELAYSVMKDPVITF